VDRIIDQAYKQAVSGVIPPEVTGTTEANGDILVNFNEIVVPGTNYSGIKVKDQTGAEIPVSKNISEDTSLLLTWNSKIQLQISI